MTHDHSPWEPTAWMRDLLRRRQADADQAIPAAFGGDDSLAIGMLTGSDPDAVKDTPEDRTCDRCRVYVRSGDNLWCGAVEHQRADGLLLLITFGLCTGCARKEGMTL